jgi:hypothetical protein
LPWRFVCGGELDCIDSNHGHRERAVAADQFKYGKPVLVTDNRFPIGQARASREPSPPLILAAWHVTMPIEKQLRFKEHIQ